MRFIETTAAASALLAAAAAAPLDVKRNVNNDFSIKQSTHRMSLKSGPAAYASVFAKYGRQAPPALKAAVAGSDGSVTATPTQFDTEYLTPVTVGGQQLILDFDTGSSDLWVFSTKTPSNEVNGHDTYDPSRSNSSNAIPGATWRITYGDHSYSSGIVYTDTVTVGTTTFAGQAVELATEVSSQFQRDAGSDGLLGLAFSTINTVRPNQQLTFFDNVKSSLSAPLFTCDLKKGEPGTYAFGTIDDSGHTGEITYVDVDSSSGYWKFPSSGYAVGDDEMNDSGLNGIADTGTTLLLIPEDIVSAYYSEVSGAQYDPQQGGYTYPCSTTLPDISFQLGSYRATVPGSYVNYAPIDDGGTTCFGGIQSSQGIGSNIFGDIFLKSQFVVFEGGASPRLGLAPKALSFDFEADLNTW